MFENLEEVKKHYEEIMENLTIPEVVSDINQYKKLILEQSNLEPVYKAYIAFRKAEESEKDALFILDNEKDKDLIEMAKEELSTAKEDQERLTKEIQLYYFRRMKMTTRISLWKSAEVPAEKRRLYLQVLYTECIRVMLKNEAGRRSSFPSMKRDSAV